MVKIQKVYSIIAIILVVSSSIIVVTTFGNQELKNQDNNQILIDIFFDSSTPTTEKLMKQLSDTFDKISVTYQCKSVEFLNLETATTNSKYQIYIFHGTEKGIMLNQKMYTWNILSQLFNQDEEKHQYLLSCYSSNINKFLENNLFSLDKEVDYMCAYLNFLLAFQEDIREDNIQVSKMIFEEAILYARRNKNILLDRLITPLESLAFNCLIQETSVQYGALLPTIRTLKAGTRVIATIIAHCYTGAKLWRSVLFAILEMFVSTMYPGFFGYLLTIDDWNIWVQSIYDEVASQDFLEMTLEDAVLDLVTDLLPDIVTQAQDAFGSTIVADALEAIGFINSMVSILVTVCSFTYKDWEVDYIMYSDSVVMALDLETYNEVLPLYNFPLEGNSLYEKLEALEDAIINDYDDIDSKLDEVSSQLVDVKEDTYDILNFPDELDDRFYLWYDLAVEHLDDIDSDLLAYIDTHAYTNTYIEMDVDDVEGGWWGGNIHIYYHFSNLGGNQVPLTYFRVDWHESSKNQDRYDVFNYEYWLVPGQTIYDDFAWTKKIWHSSEISWYCSAAILYGDLKGNFKDAHKFTNNYFPKAYNSDLVFELSGNPDENLVRFEIHRINDIYSRYLYIYINGETTPSYTYIIGSYFEKQITHYTAISTIKFRIYWGSYTEQGWRLTNFIAR